MDTVGSLLPIHVNAGVGEWGAELVRKRADDNVVPRRFGDARAGESVSSDLVVQQLLAQAAVKVPAAEGSQKKVARSPSGSTQCSGMLKQACAARQYGGS